MSYYTGNSIKLHIKCILELTESIMVSDFLGIKQQNESKITEQNWYFSEVLPDVS